MFLLYYIGCLFASYVVFMCCYGTREKFVYQLSDIYWYRFLQNLWSKINIAIPKMWQRSRWTNSAWIRVQGSGHRALGGTRFRHFSARDTAEWLASGVL